MRRTSCRFLLPVRHHSAIGYAVPKNSTVVGVPGRVVKQDNVKIPRTELDQIHLPDPIKNDIEFLKRQNEELRDMVNKLIDDTNRKEK